MRLRLLILAAALLAAMPGAAGAADESHGQLRERLFEELREAETEAAGRAAENAIWEMWMAEGPTEAIRDKMASAMRERDSYNFGKAMALLDEIVEAAPDYAEGWNQRAFIHFLRENYAASLADLEKAIELEPKHFGAIAGKGLVFMRQGKQEHAQEALKRALEINPYLRERALIQTEAKGEEI